MTSPTVATAPSEARLQESRRLSRMVVQLAERLKADFAESIASLDLPVHLARALVMMDQPAPMGELAEQLACDRSYITSLADQLTERGLVERVAGSDRRVKLLALTGEGRALRDQVAGAVSVGAMMLTRLDDEQRATLGLLLEQLLREPAID